MTRFLGILSFLLLVSVSPVDAWRKRHSCACALKPGGVPTKETASAVKPRTDFASVLAGMAPNSWLYLGLGWRGGYQNNAVFDQANRLFFKYGGCGDGTPPINISYPYGDPRYPNGYSNSCWVVNLALGDWEMRWPYDASWPSDRPANGCSRCYAYDSKRKVTWMYGGISDGGGGGDGWDMWSYDGATNRFTKSNSTSYYGNPPGGDGNGGDVFVYDPVHDILIMPRGAYTWVYSPATNTWEQRSTPNAPGTFMGHYSSMVFDVAAQRLVYQTFTDTWTYDPATNAWVNLMPANQVTPGRWLAGLTYDSKNQVVILIGGSNDTWASDEVYYNDVWILDTRNAVWKKMDPPGPWPAGQNAWRDARSCAYDEVDNVVFWMPEAGGVWAYRYDGGGVPPPPPTPPTITSQPSNQTVTAGQTATFTVTATGTSPLFYQWQKNGTDVGGATSATYTTPVTTSADGGSTYRVTVTNSAGSAISASATLTVNPSSGGGTLPSPWADRDIGSVGVSGSASYLGGAFAVCGSGADIWGTADAFHFVYQTLNGDGQIVARIVSLDSTNAWAKAGVMIRETLQPDSIFADMVITPGNGASLQWRPTTGGICGYAQAAGPAAPYYVKLVRSGSSFSGYISPDGTNWTQVGSTVMLAMASSVYIGLAVTSHDNTVEARAAIDPVTVGAGSPPPGGGATPSSSGGGGGGGGCGATGLDAAILFGLFLFIQRR